jgi:hypothetical protein
MSGAATKLSPEPKSRGWRIVAAGLLLLALALVVLYTTRPAFSSPLAIVVVAAIGLAALLLRVLVGKDVSSPVRAPLWLSVLGLGFAVAVVFADVLHLSVNVMLVSALGAIICFAISGIVVLRALRKRA